MLMALLAMTLAQAATDADARRAANVQTAAKAQSDARASPDTKASPDVVVRGRTDRERQRAAETFVRQVAPAPVQGQLGRWYQPVCPVVMGLSDALNERVAARIRSVAAAVGAPAGEPGCAGNAMVAFAADAAAEFKAIRRDKPWLVESIPLPDWQALRTSKAPVLWWSATVTESIDGNQIGMEGFKPILRQFRASRVSTLTRARRGAAVVLVDARRSDGASLDAVADYAAFVILSGTRFARPAGATGGILDLFDAAPGQRPAGLGDTDMAYLKGLYAATPDRLARVQASSIASAIVRSGKAEVPIGEGAHKIR